MQDNPLTGLDPWKALGTQVGFGLLAGWCVGYAARKLTYLVAFLIGVFVIVLQVLVYKGLVSVNWMGVEQVYQANVPRLHGLWGILSANVPYAGAFAVGFMGGFRTAR